MPERYAIIPEFPDEEDLAPLGEVLRRAMGLPEFEENIHPSSLQLGGDFVAEAYRAIFNQFGNSPQQDTP